MNLLGRRSLSSLFKVIFDIAYYAVCTAIAALLVAAALASFTDVVNVQLRLPTHFDLDPSAYRVTRADGTAVDASMTDTSGYVFISNPSNPMVFMSIVGVIAVLTVTLIVLRPMRRIFGRLVQGRPFVDENARDLRFIGLAIVGGTLAWSLLEYLSQRVIASTLSSDQIIFHASFSPRVSQLMAGLVLLIIAEIFREGIRMRADLETAREIQMSLVGAAESRHGEVSIHARMQQAAEVGGDYYDVIELGDGRLAFVVADIAGKGLPAALLMTLLRGSLRGLISTGLRGTALITALNAHLTANMPGNRMITCFYGELDPATGRLTYVNAGHNPAYLYGKDGRRTLDSTSTVLGMVGGMEFVEATAQLHAGERLLLYTDGVTEAEDEAGAHFGAERLEAAIAGPGHAEPPRVLDAIMHTVVSFRGAARQSDDMTMMLVSRDAAA